MSAKRYTQKYRSVWEKDERLKAWIGAFPGDVTKARCRICDSGIKAHMKSILGHATGKKHLEKLTTNGATTILEEAIEETLQPILIKMADGHDFAKEAVLGKSEEMPEGTPTVTGYDFNQGIDYHKLFDSFRYSGFQATSFGCAVEEIKKMIACREIPLTEENAENLQVADGIAIHNNCTIFLGYTSNMVSCGVRETIRFLVEHKLVDCIVTTAGGVEEDLIKCLANTYIGDWYLSGKELRLKGINRIGNLLVPNNNYCKFEDWVMPILDTMLQEQREEGTNWTPSKIIKRLGSEMDDPTSIAYWASRNNIPVFSPALTDGSLGDMMYFHGIKSPGLVVDINEDLQRLNHLTKKSINTGMVIVGGGLVKHHICNSNLMRNGANFSVFLNTASEWDGSDSGARPDEAVSWGKIKLDATPVKIYGEASFFFPLLVGETFARHYHQRNKEQGKQEHQDSPE